MIAPLTQFQKNLLREAWQRISKKGTSSIGSQIMRRMFMADPNMKRVFHHVTVIEGVFSFGLAPNQASQHHTELFTDILSDAIENMDDLTVIIPKLNEYGAKHAPYRAYGFKQEFWDTFGEAMIGAAREWEGWCKHRETLRGWTILISFIVDRLRQGYEQALRRPTLVHQYSTNRQQTMAAAGSARSSSVDVNEDETPTEEDSPNTAAGGDNGQSHVDEMPSRQCSLEGERRTGPPTSSSGRGRLTTTKQPRRIQSITARDLRCSDNDDFCHLQDLALGSSKGQTDQQHFQFNQGSGSSRHQQQQQNSQATGSGGGSYEDKKIPANKSNTNLWYNCRNHSDNNLHSVSDSMISNANEAKNTHLDNN